MSARDALFHYDGGQVVHLLRTWRTRPGDPRGPRALPACAARSDRPAITLSSGRADPDLSPCRDCYRTVQDAQHILAIRTLQRAAASWEPYAEDQP